MKYEVGIENSGYIIGGIYTVKSINKCQINYFGGRFFIYSNKQMQRFKLHLNLASLAPPPVCCLLFPVVFSLTISSQSALSARLRQSQP